MVMKLDTKDKKLIHELEKDGRASLSRIARAIGVSKEVANYRYKRLQKEGLLIGFKAIINHTALGRTRYSLLVNLANLEENTKEQLIAWFKQHPLIDVSFYLQSRYDLRIELQATDEQELEEFFEGFTKEFARHIKNKELSVITKSHFQRHAYLFGEQAENIESPREKVELDELEYTILRAIRQDARAGLLELAKQTDSAASTVAHKIKRLEKENVLLGVIPVLDVQQLDLDRFEVFIILGQHAKKKSIMHYIATDKRVVRVDELFGKYDFSFEIHCSTGRELDNFLTALRIAYPHISDFDVLLHV